jgi:muramidase (phage lysozyme)
MANRVSLADQLSALEASRPSLTEQITNPEGRGEFYKGVSSGIDSLQGLGYGVLGAVGQGLGIKPLQRFGAEGMQRNELEAQQYLPKVQSYKDINFGNIGSAIAYNTGALLPSVVESLGAAALGAAGGPITAGAAAVGKGFVKNKLKNYVEQGLAKNISRDVLEANAQKAAGAVGASLINAYATGVGDIYQSTSESGAKDGSVTGALLGAFPYAGLEYIGDINLAKAFGIGNLAKVSNNAADGIRSSLLRTTATGAAKQAAIEGTTEALQSGLTSGIMELNDPESMTLDRALTEMTESGIGAVLGSFIPGAAGGVSTYMRNRPAPTAAPETTEQQPTQQEPAGLLSDTRFNMPAEAAAAGVSPEALQAQVAQEQAQQAQLRNDVRIESLNGYQEARQIAQEAGVKVPKSAEVADFAAFTRKYTKENKGASRAVVEDAYNAYVQESTDKVNQLLGRPTTAQQQATLPGFEPPQAGPVQQQIEDGTIKYSPNLEQQQQTIPGVESKQDIYKRLEATYGKNATLAPPAVQEQAAPAENIPSTVPLFTQGPGINIIKQTPAAITEQPPAAPESQIVIPPTTPSKQGKVIPVGGRPTKRTAAKQDEVKSAKQWYKENRDAAQDFPQGPYAYVKATNPAILDFLGTEKGELDTDMRDFNMSKKEKEDAVQIGSTEEVPVRKRTESSERIRREDNKRADEKPAAKARDGKPTKQEVVAQPATPKTTGNKWLDLANNGAAQLARGEELAGKAKKVSEATVEPTIETDEDSFLSQRKTNSKGTTTAAVFSSLKEWYVTPERAAKVLDVVDTASEITPEVMAAIKEEAKERGVSVSAIQAFVHKGRGYMIADRIQPGTERSVFMHEIGTHLGMTSEETTRIAKQIQKWENAKEGSNEKRVYDATIARLSNANEVSNEELVAYAVEEAANIGITPQAVMRMKVHQTRDASTVAGLIKMFAKRFMDTAKALFNRQFFTPSAQDLVDFAYGAANLAMDEGAVKAGTAPSVTQAEEYAKQAQVRMSQLSKDISAKAMPRVLGFQTLNHIVETYKKRLSSLTQLKRAIDQRTADIAKFAREGGELDRRYSDWASSEGRQKVTIDGKSVTHEGKPMTQEYNMGALMGEATLENIMPGVAMEEQKSYAQNKNDAGWVKSYNRIQERWSKLGKKGQQVFLDTVALHEKMFNLVVDAKALSILRTLTPDSYRKMLDGMLDRNEPITSEWIKSQLTGTDKNEAPAGKPARKAYEAILAEQAKQGEPYLHVGRFGEYFVRVIKHPADGYSVNEIVDGKTTLVKSFPASLQGRKDAQQLADSMRSEGARIETNDKNATEHYERMETPSIMEAKKAELQNMFKREEGYDVVAGLVDSADNQALASQFFIKDMLAKIDTYVGMTDADKDAAKAMIRQLYVQSLPETSSKRVFQHRQGISGWNPNEMWRSQARRIEIATRQVGYALHDIDIQRAFENANRNVEELRLTDSLESSKLQRVVEELMLRDKEARSSPETPLIDALNRMSFTMFLAASPSFLVINLLQPTVITLPVLGGRYGFVKSAKALARNTALVIKIVRELLKDNFFRPEMKITDEMVNGKYKHFPFLTGEKREVLRKLVEAGKIDLTQAHEIGHVAAGMAHGKADKIRHFLGIFMHYSELINRASTGLAAYELATERKDENALGVAMDMIDGTQYSYELSNKPRAMGKKGIFGEATPLAMQFQQYNVNTILLLTREIRKAFGKESTPEEAIAARKTLAGIFGTSTLIAGTLGAPAATAVLALVNAIKGGDDDDEAYDAKNAYRQWLTDLFGKDFAEVVAHGVLRPTIGVDMSRAGFQDLIPGSRFLSDRRPFKDAMESLAIDIMGPSMGWLGSGIEGYNKISEGDVLSGAAMMMPKFAADIVKGVQVAQNGYILDSKGNKVPVELNTFDPLKIGLGFKPAEVAEQQEAKFAFKSIEMSQNQKKASIQREFNRAKDAGDTEGMEAAKQKARTFSENNPDNKLLVGQLYKSARQRERVYQGGLETGVPVSGRSRFKVGTGYTDVYNIKD